MADAFDFDYPVGPPNGEGYHVQQPFEEYGRIYPNEYHAGEDWQSDAGGAATAGQPVFAIADGVVVYANQYANYPGGVVIIDHTVNGGSLYSMYGHLGTIRVTTGSIRRGQQIGTIMSWPSNAANSHLHFEIRSFYITDPINGPNADNPRHRNYPPGPGYWPPIHRYIAARGQVTEAGCILATLYTTATLVAMLSFLNTPSIEVVRSESKPAAFSIFPLFLTTKLLPLLSPGDGRLESISTRTGMAVFGRENH